MTLIDAISRVRRYTRTDSTGKTDAEITDSLNEGMWQFSQDVHGLTKEGYLTLAPLFDTETNFAIRLTITGGTDAMAATDVALTGTARENASGTTVAADLQATIRTACGTANPTVTWSTTTWKFTLTTSANTTSVTIGSPSGITYINACSLLGFNEDTTTGYTVSDNIPDDCTVETALPSDYLQLVPPVEWDSNPLTLAPFDLFASPQASGTPTYYAVRNKRIRISPTPSSQKLFHIWYKYLPTEFTQGYQGVGLSGKVGTSATGLVLTTQYYFKITIDGGTQTEYDITTGTDLTYDAVIDLLNTECTEATFSIIGGDLVCTSDTVGGTSTIALAAGTTGPNLFATLTGWAAFATAVAGAGGVDINLEDEDAMGSVYYASSVIAEENFEKDIADRMYARYKKMTTDYITRHANVNPKIFPKAAPFINYKVI